MGGLQNLDVLLFDRMAAAHPRGLDRVLPRLGRSADHGTLWLAGASALALSRNRGARRAAMRGIGSLARTRLVAAFLTGTLARSRVYQAAAVSHLRIDGIHATEHYARDGEITPATDTLVLDKAPHTLTVCLPHRT